MRNYQPLLDDPNVQAFLALIRWTEGAGYRTLFGGGKFDSFADHPRQAITRTLGGKPLTSTAAGAYQFLSRTWDECAKALGLGDFSPLSQDLAALFLIDRRKALDFVIAGKWEKSIAGCNREWASLPGSPYGQPTKSMVKCLNFLDEAVRKAPAPAPAPAPVPAPEIPRPPVQEAPEARPQPQPAPSFGPENFFMPKDPPMLPFVAAAIPALIQAAPSLIRLFGDSPQSEKNAKTAEIVAGIAREVTQSPTVEGAVAALQADPALAGTFKAAVEDKWYAITGESGGGGIEGARKADRAASDSGKPWMSPALWVAMAILPLVYMVTAAVMFGADWTMEIKAMVVSSIISLVLGSITGFFLGTSYGSQKKTDMLAERK